MVKFPDTDDIDQLKKHVSEHVFEKTRRRYPPMLIPVRISDENNSLKNIFISFEKEYETKLEHIDDFDSNKFIGAIYEWTDLDCCSIYGKNLIIFAENK